MARPEASDLSEAPAAIAAPDSMIAVPSTSTAMSSPLTPATREPPSVFASAPAWAPAGVTKRYCATAPVSRCVSVRMGVFCLLMSGSP